MNHSVVSSSAESSGYAASNAVDGNSSTRWSSGQWMQPSQTGWIYVDLGSYQNFSEVRLNWESAYAADYQIQVSNDANTWSTLVNVTGNATAGMLDYSGLTGSGRYVRIYCTRTSNVSYNYSLLDFKVYY